MKYYSEKLNKVYNTIEDLEVAEKEFEARNLEVETAKKERAAAAKDVEDAYKAANEARKVADAKMNEFIKKYGSYHKTITNVSPVANNFFSDFFWNNFWFK